MWIVIGTVATLILAIVAVFHELIEKLIYSPKLFIELDFQPPHCHKVSNINRLTGDHLYFSYYFALKIWNKGRNKAENVEVVVLDIFKKLGQSWDRIPNFNPDNLVWRLNGQSSLPVLNRESYKQCNIGYIIDPEARKNIKVESRPDYNLKETVFHVQVSKPSANYPHLLDPGIYRLVISANCSNGKGVKNINYIIQFSGQWFEDEARMLSEGITIQQEK